MPTGLIIIFVFIIIGITIYNEIHRSKYNKLMAHLEQHHPDIYEKIRIKPVFGPFYAKGAYKTSLDYARSHEPLNDPIAEELLADYGEFSFKGLWIIVVTAIIGFVVLFGMILFFESG